MNKKLFLIPILSIVVIISVLQNVNAATITAATLDKNTYLAGQTGYILVTIYNEDSEKIRVAELTATIDYYYTDGTVYLQKFFTSDTLPDEIPAGQSQIFQIPISLPNNIANGYTNPLVEARTEIWHPQTDTWTYSDYQRYSNIKLYIESPYKEWYTDSQQQLVTQKSANDSLTTTTNVLAIATVVLASAAGIMMFLMFTKKARVPTAA
jgi:hypothetical protein